MPGQPEILYQDKDIMAVVKPFGMPSQSDPSEDLPLLEWAADYLGHEAHLLHRLDRPTGGIVLIGVSLRGARSVSRQFAERTIQKTYLAVTLQCPPEMEFSLTHFIGKLPGKNFVRAYDKPVRGAKPAHMSGRVRATKDGLTLLEIQPTTGRRHQIRAQLRTLNCAIVGDLKYGKGKPLDYPGIALWANSLKFALPDAEMRAVVANPPALYPWSEFEFAK